MPSAAVIVGSQPGISSPTAGTGSGCILDSISRTSCSTVCRSILGAAAASGVSAPQWVTARFRTVLAPTLPVQDRGHPAGWLGSPAQIDNPAQLFSRPHHLPVFVAACDRTGSVEARSPQRVPPTLPGLLSVSEAAESRHHKITLPVRSSIFRLAVRKSVRYGRPGAALLPVF